MSGKRGVDFLKVIADYVAKSTSFDNVMRKINITGGGDGKCVAEFIVCEEHLNQKGGLHGGFTATLIDNVTTFALMSKPCHPGVSVDLHVSYLKSAKEGDLIVVDASTIKAGKRLAFLECELRNKNDGSIIAKGAHTKFVDFEDTIDREKQKN